MKTFQEIFSIAIASAIMPRQWTYQDELRDFSSQLFSKNAQLETLLISLSNGFPIQFDVPLAVMESAVDTALNWAYMPRRLDQQKTILERKIGQLYKRLSQRRVEIDNLVKLSKFPKKIRAVKKRTAKLKKDLKNITRQLGQSEDHIHNLLQASPFKGKSVNQLCPITSGDYQVVFQSTDIRGMGRQACRIIHTLLSNPSQSFDMYLLYANTQNLRSIAVETSAKSQENSNRGMILRYIREELIRPKELDEARKTGTLDLFRLRLEKGIQLLIKCVKLYPDLELGSVLQDYQHYYEEYWGEGRVEDSFDPPIFQDSVPITKRKARERISKQLKLCYSDLDKNGFQAFSKYLQEVIKREEERGVHYYTFRPGAASSQKWRTIDWSFISPNE